MTPAQQKTPRNFSSTSLVLLIYALILLLALPGCLRTPPGKKDSGSLSVADCDQVGLITPSSQTNLNNSKKYNFGPTKVGDTNFIIFRLRLLNLKYRVSNFKGEFSATQFSFGGPFPGRDHNSGGCTPSTTIGGSAKDECQINIDFKPIGLGHLREKFTLKYTINNKLYCMKTIDLYGEGVSYDR